MESITTLSVKDPAAGLPVTTSADVTQSEVSTMPKDFAESDVNANTCAVYVNTAEAQAENSETEEGAGRKGHCGANRGLYFTGRLRPSDGIDEIVDPAPNSEDNRQKTDLVVSGLDEERPWNGHAIPTSPKPFHAIQCAEDRTIGTNGVSNSSTLIDVSDDPANCDTNQIFARRNDATDPVGDVIPDWKQAEDQALDTLHYRAYVDPRPFTFVHGELCHRSRYNPGTREPLDYQRPVAFIRSIPSPLKKELLPIDVDCLPDLPGSRSIAPPIVTVSAVDEISGSPVVEPKTQLIPSPILAPQPARVNAQARCWMKPPWSEESESDLDSIHEEHEAYLASLSSNSNANIIPTPSSPSDEVIVEVLDVTEDEASDQIGEEETADEDEAYVKAETNIQMKSTTNPRHEDELRISPVSDDGTTTTAAMMYSDRAQQSYSSASPHPLQNVTSCPFRTYLTATFDFDPIPWDFATVLQGLLSTGPAALDSYLSRLFHDANVRLRTSEHMSHLLTHALWAQEQDDTPQRFSAWRKKVFVDLQNERWRLQTELNAASRQLVKARETAQQAETRLLLLEQAVEYATESIEHGHQQAEELRQQPKTPLDPCDIALPTSPARDQTSIDSFESALPGSLRGHSVVSDEDLTSSSPSEQLSPQPWTFHVQSPTSPSDRSASPIDSPNLATPVPSSTSNTLARQLPSTSCCSSDDSLKAAEAEFSAAIDRARALVRYGLSLQVPPQRTDCYDAFVAARQADAELAEREMRERERGVRKGWRMAGDGEWIFEGRQEVGDDDGPSDIRRGDCDGFGGRQRRPLAIAPVRRVDGSTRSGLDARELYSLKDLHDIYDMDDIDNFHIDNEPVDAALAAARRAARLDSERYPTRSLEEELMGSAVSDEEAEYDEFDNPSHLSEAFEERNELQALEYDQMASNHAGDGTIGEREDRRELEESQVSELYEGAEDCRDIGDEEYDEYASFHDELVGDEGNDEHNDICEVVLHVDQDVENKQDAHDDRHEQQQYQEYCSDDETF